MRSYKNVNGTVYYYHYVGDTLTEMTWGNNKMSFIYDALGPSGLIYNGTTYYYVRNVQGDVIGIVDASGGLVETYIYDAWGNPLNVPATEIGQLNPLRYRSYVYDQETGLYYLQSRYYSPSLGRFFNADNESVLVASPSSATWDKNLFAYCDNNPVSRKDDGGQFWHIAIGAVLGLATQYASDVITNIIEGDSFFEALTPTSTWADYGAAAASGALAATGIGLGAAVVSNAAIGGMAYLANCEIKGATVNLLDLGIATGIGAASGLVGGSGADGSRLIGVANRSKQVLETAVSPKKIAMYSEKIAVVRNKTVVSTLRTSTASFLSNGLNFFRKFFTGSVA